MKSRTYVTVRTAEEYDEALRLFEAFGYLWASGSSPTSLSYWYVYEKESCATFEIEEKDKWFVHNPERSGMTLGEYKTLCGIAEEEEDDIDMTSIC